MWKCNIGWTVGFQAILDQRLAFTTLDENWIAHALQFKRALLWRHVSLKARKQGKTSLRALLPVVYRPFWNGVWRYCHEYRSDLMLFKCWRGFRFYSASFLHRDYTTDVWLAIIAHATESPKKLNKLVSGVELTFEALPRATGFHPYTYPERTRWRLQ